MDNEVKIVAELEETEIRIISDGTFLKGDKGEKGDTGEVGPQGLQGEQGNNGKSVYQEWLDLGNDGTEQDFINSLKGPKGETGPQGLKGENGIGTLSEIQTIVDDLFLERKATTEDALAGTNDSKYITSYALSSVLGNLIRQIPSAVENLLLEKDKQKYHVGKLVLETSNTNPATYLGFGTWVLWGSGRVPVGVDLEDIDFNEVEKIGGEKEHILTIDETPNHRHEKLYSSNGKERKAGYGSTGTHTGTLNENTATDFESLNTGYTGGDQAHNNLPPFITCYIWKRIA